MVLDKREDRNIIMCTWMNKAHKWVQIREKISI